VGTDQCKGVPEYEAAEGLQDQADAATLAKAACRRSHGLANCTWQPIPWEQKATSLAVPWTCTCDLNCLDCLVNSWRFTAIEPALAGAGQTQRMPRTKQNLENKT